VKIQNKSIQERNDDGTPFGSRTVIPRGRGQHKLFEGWGPRLLSIAFVLGAASLSSVRATAAEAPPPGPCIAPDQPAQVRFVPEPGYPQIAALEGVTGTTVIVVHIAANNELTNYAIKQSSGSRALDQEALRVVRETRFAAGLGNCTPVEGDYLFNVEFEP